MARNPEALVLAGGTGILMEHGNRTIDFPPVVVAIHEISEFGKLARTERFLEIGSGVTLAELAAYNPGSIHPSLLQAIRGVATVPIRNLATIGGNISSRSRFMDLWPVLACLDSLVELRTSGENRWININRLADESGAPFLPSGSIVSRIRVPLERWDVNIVIKVGQKEYPSPETSVFAVTARIGKGVVNDFHLVMAGERCFRSRELESTIVGQRLPLEEDTIEFMAMEYRKQYGERHGRSDTRIGRLPEFALRSLAE